MATQEVDTETVTELTTTTITVVSGAAQSAAAPTRAEQTSITAMSSTTSMERNAKPSIFSSVLAQPSAFIASVCTCLETQPTIYVTTIPTTTVTVTAVPTASLTVTDTT